MATDPPDPLPVGAWTLFSAEFNLGRKIEHLFDYWAKLVEGDTPEWARFDLLCEDLVSQDIADDAVCTFDFVNFTSGNIDGTWTTDDYNGVANHVEAIASAWAPYMDTHHRFNMIKAYRMSYRDGWAGSSPSSKLYPFNITGPPEYTRAISHTGSDGFGSQVPQAACSVTEIVPIRRNWGRFYLPFPGVGFVDQANNRWSNSKLTIVCDAVAAAYSAAGSAETFPVIPMTANDGDRVASLQAVTSVRCDNVADVIRRRRHKHSSFSHTVALSG
jgi:hypothetical protein